MICEKPNPVTDEEGEVKNLQPPPVRCHSLMVLASFLILTLCPHSLRYQAEVITSLQRLESLVARVAWLCETYIKVWLGSLAHTQQG